MIRVRLGSVLGYLVICLLQSPVAASHASDWPMYRRDPARSAVTPDTLVFPLERKWAFRPPQAPCPAWPEPGKEMHRMDFDYAFHPVVAGGMVFFGSSADDTVRALDLRTGRLLWRFVTDGPIRFAPAFASGRLYVASDDGRMYCLEAATGAPLWTFRGAPGTRKLIGNGRMISRWPLRSGVLVVDGVVYTTAGMWPTEGVYVYALDAESGRELWCNDSSGYRYVTLPHPGASGFSGVAPQGYLCGAGRLLLVNTGRNIPAAFDRDAGKLVYYRPGYAMQDGGTRTIVVGDLFLTPKNAGSGQMDGGRPAHVGEAAITDEGMAAYSLDDCRKQFVLNGAYDVLVSPDTAYVASTAGIQACHRQDVFSYRRIRPKAVRWTVPHGRVYSLACTATALLVGGRRSLTALAVESGEVLWESATDGRTRGLAISQGRVVAATQKGTLLCFGPAAGPAGTQGKDRQAEGDAQPPEEEEADRNAWAARAGEILDRTGVSAGYALVVGNQADRLAQGLALHGRLKAIGLVRPDRLESARRRLVRLGWYGSRVALHPVSEGESLPFASWFAGLVVVSGTRWELAIEELYRVTRPCGGTLVFTDLDPPQAVARLRAAHLPGHEISVRTGTLVRQALPGAGEWRYELADAGRTGMGTESRLHFPLELLWFGGPGPARMLDRGARTSAPLSVGGRVFVTGERHLIAFDAYTGQELWCRELAGVGRRSARHSCANVVADETHLYVAISNGCFRVRQDSGQIIASYALPAALADETEVETAYIMYESKEEPETRVGRMQWGYVGVSDGLVLGSLRFPRTHQWDIYPRYSTVVFALRCDDGELVWLHRARRTIPDNHIVLGQGKVFFLDAVLPREMARAVQRDGGRGPLRSLVALNLKSGAEIWRTDDIPARIYEREKYWAYCRQLQYASGRLVLSANAVYDADTGEKVREHYVEYRHKPLISDDTLIAPPYAYDLETGDKKTLVDPLSGKETPWSFTRAYGCGSQAGCSNLLFFRSGVLGMLDMETGGMANFGGIRPGCNVNTIPANGLLIMPEASSGCSCSYNYQTSLALAPARKAPAPWLVLPDRQSSGEVREMRINLGAPGSKLDSRGRAWRPFPRPGLAFGADKPPAEPVTVLMQPQEFFHHPGASGRVMDMARPWLYTSGVRGEGKVSIDTVLRTGVVAPYCSIAPAVDGVLEDACWQELAPVPLAGDGHLEPPAVSLFMCQDTNHFYFAFQRRAAVQEGRCLPFAASHTNSDDVLCREDDSLEIALADRYQLTAFHFGVNPAGARFDGRRNARSEDLGFLKLGWDADWRTETRCTEETWCTEIAVAKRSLAQLYRYGEPVRINVIVRNRSGQGMPARWLVDPELAFTRGRQFLPLCDEAPPPPRQRFFTVRLYFMEPSTDEAGRCIFDVRLQGKAVLKAFAPTQEAGGPGLPVVKEFRDVSAGGRIDIELRASQTGHAAPVLNAIEIVEQRHEARPEP